MTEDIQESPTQEQPKLSLKTLEQRIISLETKLEALSQGDSDESPNKTDDIAKLKEMIIIIADQTGLKNRLPRRYSAIHCRP